MSRIGVVEVILNYLNMDQVLLSEVTIKVDLM